MRTLVSPRAVTVTSRLCALGAAALACGTALFAACNPAAFDELRDEAGIVVAEAPDGYARAGYGSVIASFTGVLGGVSVSRLAASAGADSQTRVYTAWTGSALQMDPAAYDLCKDPGDCEAGAGESLSGLTSWRGQALCVAVGGPASDLVLVRCEDSPSMSIERVMGPSGTQFGASIAVVGDLMFVGAPQANGGTGAVYAVNTATGVVLPEIALPSAFTAGVTRIGTQIAAAALPLGGAFLVITAPGTARRRVLVVEVNADATVATPRACLEDLDDANPAFGSVVAVGTLVGFDNVPDVVIADDPSLPSRREEVRIYDGGLVGAASGECPASSFSYDILPCTDARGVACLGSGFGSSIAIGDVDGDGDGDLAIGAPEATFDGVSRSGAVWLVPGNGMTLESTGADVLTDSEPATSARLGTSVAMVETRTNPMSPGMRGEYAQRSEVAAGAPGSAEVFVFACSGLSGDGVTAGPRCIPAM